VNIVVLAGGTSTERDVSIMTSMMVCGSLRRNGHHANMIDVFTGSGKYKHSSEFFQEDNDLKKLADSMKEQSAGIAKLVEERERIGGGFFGPGVLELCQAADIVYIGLHGANGEDGKIQAAFDLMGIKYTGTGYLSSAISMSKELTKKVLVSEGVPMPKGISLKKGHKIEYVPYPCPANLPADVAQKMQRWAVKACQAVGIETCGRVDMLLNEDEDIFCLEINTLPGMTETSLIPQEAAAVGMSYDQLTQKIVEISMNKYNK